VLRVARGFQLQTFTGLLHAWAYNWLTPRPFLVIPLVSVAFAIAACGGSTNPSANAASNPSSPSTQVVKYADCLRTHGMPNFPDPNSNGANAPLPAPTPGAERACAKLQPLGMHLHGPPAPSATRLRAALVFARCMRRQGLSQFPDPLTTVPDVPNFTLAPGEYFPLDSSTQVQSPAFRHAAKACGVRLPTGAP
jgi:hypothetical protein